MRPDARRFRLGGGRAEVYANGRACQAARICPTRPGGPEVHVLARGGRPGRWPLGGWEIGSIWRGE